MGLVNEIFNSLDMSITSNEYRYYNLGGKAVYIENFIKIIAFSKEEIILKLKKGMFKVTGSELKIVELNKGSMLISGSIKGVEVYWKI